METSNVTSHVGLTCRNIYLRLEFANFRKKNINIDEMCSNWKGDYYNKIKKQNKTKQMEISARLKVESPYTSYCPIVSFF